MDAQTPKPTDEQSLDEARVAARRLVEEATRLWSLMMRDAPPGASDPEALHERRCHSANHAARLLNQVGDYLNAEAFKGVGPDAPPELTYHPGDTPGEWSGV